VREDLVGLAAPADRLHHLAPQPDQPALARAVEAQREHAAVAFGLGLAVQRRR